MQLCDVQCNLLDLNDFSRQRDNAVMKNTELYDKIVKLKISEFSRTIIS